MHEVIIFGEASQKEVKKIKIRDMDLNKTILEFLQDNDVPIASSCMGEGVCKMCVINDESLSCLKFVKDILLWEKKVINISYL